MFLLSKILKPVLKPICVPSKRSRTPSLFFSTLPNSVPRSFPVYPKRKSYGKSMKTAAKVIFISDDVDGAFSTAIIDGLKPDASSTFERSKESFDLSLDRYGITDTKASGTVTHFIDSAGVNQVSILVLQKYEPPILACAISEVLVSLEEDTSAMPSLIFPFLLDSSKLKLESKNSPNGSIYGIQIGPETDTIRALASSHTRAPSSMQILHEPLSCVLQLVRALNTASFILLGQCGQQHKTRMDEFEIMCEMGETLGKFTSMQFAKEKVKWKPSKVSRKQENEAWRDLYG